MNISLLLISVLIVLGGCKAPSDMDQLSKYPKIVTDNNLEYQYDIAKFELYKLNSCCDCSCNMRIYGEKGQIREVNSLEADYQIDTIEIEIDTIKYHFSLYGRIEGQQHRARIIENTGLGCTNFHSIAFLKGAKIPFKSYWGEWGEATYQYPRNRDNLDKNFKKCLNIHQKNMNKWLNEFLKR